LIIRPHFTQLGVNSDTAVRDGAYANKPQFFGIAIAETLAQGASQNGGWNGDDARAIYSSEPWTRRGTRADVGATAGAFAFSSITGGTTNIIGHRTILSGY
jgi:hypothetical protein